MQNLCRLIMPGSDKWLQLDLVDIDTRTCRKCKSKKPGPNKAESCVGNKFDFETIQKDGSVEPLVWSHQLNNNEEELRDVIPKNINHGMVDTGIFWENPLLRTRAKKISYLMPEYTNIGEFTDGRLSSLSVVRKPKMKGNAWGGLAFPDDCDAGDSRFHKSGFFDFLNVLYTNNRIIDSQEKTLGGNTWTWNQTRRYRMFGLMIEEMKDYTDFIANCPEKYLPGLYVGRGSRSSSSK